MKILGKRQLHFKLEVNGIFISYCYIRKNACSSWKKVFSGLSKHREESIKYSNLINFMGKYHKIKTKDELEKIEESIIVFREPSERLFSGFINQYAMRINRQTEMHKSVSRIVGKSPESVTFYDFINKYIRKVSEDEIDAHFWSQKSHMADIEYKNKWPIEKLYENAEDLFGKSIADKYFLKRSNSTYNFKRYEDFDADVTSGEIFERYSSQSMLPSYESMMAKDIVNDVRSLYFDDCLLYKNSIYEKNGKGF